MFMHPSRLSLTTGVEARSFRQVVSDWHTITIVEVDILIPLQPQTQQTKRFFAQYLESRKTERVPEIFGKKE
jgi:hypothetical protein